MRVRGSKTLAPFLVMLREGIEAALIVGIIASYLRQTGRSAWMPAVWIGILLAIAASFLAGAVLQFASAEFPQKAQELFEALVGLLAVGVLVSMVFWMRKAARSMKSELQRAVDGALQSGPGTGWPLVGMVFFAVMREGLESVFFLLAIFQQSPTPLAPLGALAGLLCAAAIGYLVYIGGMQINMRRFFTWTGIFILVVAAGILSSALRNLHEAGLWNLLQARAYDLSEILPVSSVTGTVLSGLFSYQEAPAVGEVFVYVAFLVVSLFFFLRESRASLPSTLARPAEEPGP
ncbi:MULTISPECIES: iron uptake transporter permease EfeU [unclassified Chelatococcus]|uniref:iron uptake transporter permease EfeU n=1 Tax=unclassified Chelatococcus TaxID=2638111 RepID=UPI0024BE795A|nr:MULTISPECIES: iron uptake transporter permease EfeU [unclassified Chelatococcus]